MEHINKVFNLYAKQYLDKRAIQFYSQIVSILHFPYKW